MIKRSLSRFWPGQKAEKSDPKEVAKQQKLLVAERQVLLIAKRQELLQKVELLIGQKESVRDACEKAGVTRSQFYKWRARRCEDPVNGLQSLSKRAGSHPRNLSPTERERILTLARDFPDDSYAQLKRRLEGESIVRSSTTIRNLLKAANIGQKETRGKWVDIGSRLQLQKLPNRRGKLKTLREYRDFRQRIKPGQLVFQSFYSIAAPERLGKLYLHFIYDFSTELVWFDLGWGVDIDGAPQARDSVALLRSGAVTAFKEKGVAIERVGTGAHAIFVGQSDSCSEGCFAEDTVKTSSSLYLNALKGARVEHEVIEEKSWEKNHMSSVLQRLKEQFPDSKTRSLFIRERRKALRLKNADARKLSR